MHAKSWLSAGLVAALIVASGAMWLTRDQRQIHRNLNRLRQLLSTSAGKTTLSELIRIKEITDYFAAPIDVNLGVPWPNLKDRQMLAAAIQQAHSMAQTIKIIIRNKTLEIRPDRKSAMMVIASEAIVTMGDQTERDIRELRLMWIKQQGKWLISKVEQKETIHRPPGLGEAYF